jgi:hypothetical protein
VCLFFLGLGFAASTFGSAFLALAAALGATTGAAFAFASSDATPQTFARSFQAMPALLQPALING